MNVMVRLHLYSPALVRREHRMLRCRGNSTTARWATDSTAGSRWQITSNLHLPRMLSGSIPVDPVLSATGRAMCSLAGRCSAPARDGDEVLGFVQRRKRIAAGVTPQRNLHPSAILCGPSNRRHEVGPGSTSGAGQSLDRAHVIQQSGERQTL
jgi:hypothetical protein